MLAGNTFADNTNLTVTIFWPMIQHLRQDLSKISSAMGLFGLITQF